MVKNHADSNLTPKFLGSILIWKGQVPFQRNHSRFSWCFTCQATFGNFDPYEAQVVDQVAAAFGYGLNNKDEGYFYSNNQVRVEPEEVVKLKTWSWSHLGWCFFVELQRPDEQSVFTMAWSLWFFPVLILVAAVLYFLSLMFFWFCIFFGLVGELNLWTWWVFSDLELKLWISRDTIPRGRVQHCCTPSREFGRISYLMGNIWLQRQLFSQKAVEACWGYKWAQEKIFLIFPSGVFFKTMRCRRWNFGRSSKKLSCCPFAENCGTWSHRENRASSKRLWKSCPTTTAALSEDMRCGGGL